MEPEISVLVADDHPVVRQGLTSIIEKQPGYRIVAQCGDGQEALELFRTVKPQLGVLDINMPGLNGLDLARELSGDPVTLVVLTMYKDKAYLEEALALGVKGYVLKESAIRDLRDCLGAVCRGEVYISPVLTKVLVAVPRERGLNSQPSSPLEKLTPSERRVLQLIAQNKTSREIAHTLFISHRTVQNHRFHMCSKLGLRGHNKLLQFALEHKDVLGRTTHS